MKKYIHWIDRKAHTARNSILISTHIDFNQNGLGVFRILFGLYSLLFSEHYWGWLKSIPSALYRNTRWNFFNIFSDFPADWFIDIMDITMLICMVCITIGYRTRLTSMVAFFIMLIMDGFAYNLGKIDHEIMMTLIFPILAFTNSRAKIAIRPETHTTKKTHDRAIALYAIVIVFGLFTSGVPKIPWMDFNTSTNGILRWYYEGYYVSDRVHLLAPYFKYVPIFLVEITDHFIPLFEMAGLYFLLKSRKTWYTWLFALCVFHLGNTLVLNIPFIPQVFAYGVFILPKFYNLYLKNTRLNLWVIYPIGIILGCNNLFGILFKNQSTYFPIENNLYTGLATWIVLTILALSILLKKHPKPDTPL
ncbi:MULTISPECIES: hypothetical protein [Reichenbachiella]|uniref:hypothetical protein n=1 Tax=Reichenbachiella TaxID=156993 RepID=UPI000E6C1AEF|nr:MULTISPECIES: hypothetical protein [Reichenbachiella]MBU2912396.1 hypothetical protein [Reichenbachiella agariperforans]RJE72733.1 hypothetical protein BGP76_01850 [Reichenbachiella sp. MSK19-1]